MKCAPIFMAIIRITELLSIYVSEKSALFYMENNGDTRSTYYLQGHGRIECMQKYIRPRGHKMIKGSLL